jgi:hypothetical protein
MRHVMLWAALSVCFLSAGCETTVSEETSARWSAGDPMSPLDPPPMDTVIPKSAPRNAGGGTDQGPIP